MEQIRVPVVERDEELVVELHRLGVRHLLQRHTGHPGAVISPVQLMAELAAHSQARMRGALILLFLRRPSFSLFVPQTLASLSPDPANTLRLYYQAAAYLRVELDEDLRRFGDDQAELPDLFSEELSLQSPQTIASVDDALNCLGALHQRLSGWAFNWSGSYRQNIGLFRRQLKRYANESVST